MADIWGVAIVLWECATHDAADPPRACEDAARLPARERRLNRTLR